jgi:hypothetical protein
MATGPLWQALRQACDVGAKHLSAAGANPPEMSQRIQHLAASPAGTPVHRYFHWAFVVTIAGLAAAITLGWATTGTLSGTLTIFFICAILTVLEISLSFDNAIVNANILKNMHPKWQHRFLTWGILIAVFGMRIVFPLLVVMVAAGLGPIEAVTLAAAHPAEYGRIMKDAHLPIAAFGGTFLILVALSFFLDHEKDIHWVSWLEARLSSLGALRSVEIVLVLFVVVIFSLFQDGDDSLRFVHAAVYGLVTFVCVDVLSKVLDSRGAVAKAAGQGGLGAFLYLEILDASFSFDGVVGAFALSQNLFVIAIGLGIGAMYVRSMTIMLVQRGTLSKFRFLEHGAFYAIFILGLLMFAQSVLHISEAITGLCGALIIGISFWSSVRWNRNSCANTG